MGNEVICFNERSLKLLKDNDLYYEIYDNLIKSMWKYANFLLNESLEIRKLKDQKDGHDSDWYRKEIQNLDNTRRNLHNLAIDNINITNRCCLKLNINLIYDGECDDKHRVEVADSICEYFKDILFSKIDNIFS